MDADKNSKKNPNQIEAQIRCPSDIEFVWVVKLLGVLAHFHVKPNLGWVVVELMIELEFLQKNFNLDKRVWSFLGISTLQSFSENQYFKGQPQSDS